MAQRFHLPMTVLSSRQRRLADGWSQFLGFGDGLRRVWVRDRRQVVWQALWLPYWFGSERPAPSLWRGPPRAGASGDFAPAGPEAYVRASMAGLVRRFWFSWMVGSVLRGIWLSLAITLTWMCLAIVGVAAIPSLLMMAACALVMIVLGLVFGALNRPTRSMVAAMLDRTFLLQERLTTACDAVDLERRRQGDRINVSRLQLADAANVFDDVRTQLSRARFVPVREVVGVLIAGMALLTAIFAYVPDRPLPGLADSPIPAFVPASLRLSDPRIADPQAVSPPGVEESAPTVAEVHEQSRASQASRDDLGTIGKALEDHPTTQPAAAAIASGDYGTAADALRSAATDAPSISQDERDALADELDQAADQVSEENPDLARASREAADGLRQGGAESTAALSGLADEIEDTAEGIVPPDQLAQDLEEAQSGANGQQGSGSQSSGGQEGEAQENQGSGQQSEGSGDGALSDPGEGVAAQPGVASENQQGSESGSSQGQQLPEGDSPGGQGQEGAGSAPDDAAGRPAQEPSADGAASSGDASGESGSQNAGDGSASSGDAQDITGGPDEETSASQGSGAGTGQTGANDSPEGEQTVDSPAPVEGADPNAEVPQNGAASDTPPSGESQPGDSGESGSVREGSSSLVLEGTSDNGVQTGSDSGSSSLGSGSGAGAASGDQAQSEVGVAGPDSNRVPEDKRDIVEDYFSGPGGAP